MGEEIVEHRRRGRPRGSTGKPARKMDRANALREWRDPDVLTMGMEAVRHILGISRSLVYKLATEDRLGVSVLRLGRYLRVSKAALRRLLEDDPQLESREAEKPPSVYPAGDWRGMERLPCNPDDARAMLCGTGEAR